MSGSGTGNAFRCRAPLPRQEFRHNGEPEAPGARAAFMRLAATVQSLRARSVSSQVAPRPPTPWGQTELDARMAVEAVIREPVSGLLFPDTAENTGIFALSEIFQMEGHVKIKAISVC